MNNHQLRPSFQPYDKLKITPQTLEDIVKQSAAHALRLKMQNMGAAPWWSLEGLDDNNKNFYFYLVLFSLLKRLLFVRQNVKLANKLNRNKKKKQEKTRNKLKHIAMAQPRRARRNKRKAAAPVSEDNEGQATQPTQSSQVLSSQSKRTKLAIKAPQEATQEEMDKTNRNSLQEHRLLVIVIIGRKEEMSTSLNIYLDMTVSSC